MTVKDSLHQPVDQLDEHAAREALAYLQALTRPQLTRRAPIAAVEDLEIIQLPSQAVVEIQEPEA
jgi:hypothetical protein